MAPTNSNTSMPRPDRKEMVLLLWRDFSREMVELDMVEARLQLVRLT